MQEHVPGVPPSHLLAHVGTGLQEQFLHLWGQVSAHLSRAHGAQSAQGQALYWLNPLAQVTAGDLGGWSVKPLRKSVLFNTHNRQSPGISKVPILPSP